MEKLEEILIRFAKEFPAQFTLFKRVILPTERDLQETIEKIEKVGKKRRDEELEQMLASSCSLDP